MLHKELWVFIGCVCLLGILVVTNHFVIQYDRPHTSPTTSSSPDKELFYDPGKLADVQLYEAWGFHYPKRFFTTDWEDLFFDVNKEYKFLLKEIKILRADIKKNKNNPGYPLEKKEQTLIELTDQKDIIKNKLEHLETLLQRYFRNLSNIDNEIHYDSWFAQHPEQRYRIIPREVSEEIRNRCYVEWLTRKINPEIYKEKDEGE